MKCPNCDIRNDMEDDWYGQGESNDVTHVMIYEDERYNRLSIFSTSSGTTCENKIVKTDFVSDLVEVVFRCFLQFSSNKTFDSKFYRLRIDYVILA